MTIVSDPEGLSPGSSDEDDPYLSPKRGSTEIYLIRHADALPGADEVVSGGVYDDQSISALGRRQAQALAERLATTRITAVYSSPVARARQTAAAVARVKRLEVRARDDLREVAVGPFGPDPPPTATAGEVADILRARLNELARVILATGVWSSIAGSEDSAALRSRVTAAVERIAADHRGERIALVSHGGVINAYIAEVVHIERDYFFPCANASISVVRVNGDRRLLMGLNDVAHLRNSAAR